jgi:hypothetical protein
MTDETKPDDVLIELRDTISRFDGHDAALADINLLKQAADEIERLRATAPRQPASPSVDGETRELIGDIIQRFHRNSCYPNAMSCEIAAVVDTIIAALSAPRSVELRCICDTDHPLFKERGHHPQCPASETVVPRSVEAPVADGYDDVDMAAVGRALMQAIEQARTSDPWMKNWSPLQCPSEIVFDLLNRASDEAAPPPQPDTARWRHKKRGTMYTEIGRGHLQLTDPTGLADMQPMVLYRGDADGSLWCRPADEFGDGRFEEIEGTPVPASIAQPDTAVREVQGALVKLAAECHRVKWQFYFNDENCLPVRMACDMVKRAFDELHRIGDLALKAKEVLAALPQPEAVEPITTEQLDKLQFGRVLHASKIPRARPCHGGGLRDAS